MFFWSVPSRQALVIKQRQQVISTQFGHRLWGFIDINTIGQFLFFCLQRKLNRLLINLPATPTDRGINQTIPFNQIKIKDPTFSLVF